MGSNRTTPLYWTIITAISVTSRAAIFASATFAAVAISACGGPVPTQQEIKEDNINSRAQQLVRVGDTTREAGDFVNAMQLYRRAAEMRPGWAEPLVRFGETAITAGLYEDALSAYDQVAGIEPKNRTGYNGAGIALDLLGRHEEAQSRYITGMERAPDNLPLRNNLGLSLAIAGDLKEAETWLESVAGRSDANARTRQNLALVYGLAGDVDKARETGLKDLSAAQVENNLAFYAKLRTMPPDQRRKAIFGALQ